MLKALLRVPDHAELGKKLFAGILDHAIVDIRTILRIRYARIGAKFSTFELRATPR